jgi:hypothetical protein
MKMPCQLKYISVSSSTFDNFSVTALQYAFFEARVKLLNFRFNAKCQPRSPWLDTSLTPRMDYCHVTLLKITMEE